VTGAKRQTRRRPRGFPDGLSAGRLGSLTAAPRSPQQIGVPDGTSLFFPDLIQVGRTKVTDECLDPTRPLIIRGEASIDRQSGDAE